MTDVGLEEQFILRVPPEVAKQIHHMMKDNDLDDLEFSFTGNIIFSTIFSHFNRSVVDIRI